ncbi:7836_t:CDS:2 [Cetraspora pellucida]|uniref:7836_t:CDS:1 n=1 Tax=Cetraspora pellucida TaxID=1433469 RepID=A0A9N9IUP5_9GLOM|nr:7836_t:CDS:2 [Cetraspora pellucida]
MEQKKPLKYGLNIVSSKKTPTKRISIFTEEDINNEEDSNINTSSNKNKYTKTVNQQLLSSNSINQSVQEKYKAALEEDPTVFAYDEVYDDMKSVERKRKEELKEKNDGSAKKPKYVEDILKAAEVRQRDYIRAQERKIQKEREAEGDEFDDKETFVTSAYKAQQEELRKAEEEEKLREKNDGVGGKNMASFYRNLLDQTSSVKAAAIEASRLALSSKKAEKRARSSSTSDNSDEDDNKHLKTDKELADQARATGKMVVLNDDEQLVDKRQLLSPGLNVTKKQINSSKSSRSTESRTNYYDKTDSGNKYSSRNSNEIKRRERQSREVERQILETQQKKEAEEKAQEEQILKQFARKNDEQAISDAKARYLARKKKAQI